MPYALIDNHQLMDSLELEILLHAIQTGKDNCVLIKVVQPVH